MIQYTWLSRIRSSRLATWVLLSSTLSLTLVVQYARGWEIDNFYKRQTKLRDSLPEANAEMNRRIQRGVEATKSCNFRELYNNVYNSLDSGSALLGISGGMEKWAEKSKDLDKIRGPSAGRSVYAKTPFANSISNVGFWLDLFPSGQHQAKRSQQDEDEGSSSLEPVIELNGVRIGVDKLGHFQDQGWDYFEEAYKLTPNSITVVDNGLSSALRYGKSLEEGPYGWSATGIKSHGDLAANYDGMRFWYRLAGGSDPHVKCTDGRFEIVKTFDFKDYVTDAWDEAINCSVYQSPAMEMQVRENLKQMKMSCPVSPEKCEALASSYSPQVLRSLLSPDCQQLALEGKGKPSGSKRENNNYQPALQ